MKTLLSAKTVLAKSTKTGKSEYYHVDDATLLNERNIAQKFNPWWEESHRTAVEQAIAEGKIASHPDYPELTKTTPTQQPKLGSFTPIPKDWLGRTLYNWTGGTERAERANSAAGVRRGQRTVQEDRQGTGREDAA